MSRGKIVWGENFATNIPSIDEQHKKFIEILNRLHDSCGVGSSQDAISALFTELKNYADIHFRYEEQLLEKHGYPSLKEQYEEHKKFNKELHKLQEKFLLGFGLTSNLDTSNFLGQWFSHHILKVDKKYTDFLREQGAK